MNNMMDYLGWRGDLSFSTDPFNEVDNLILSELAYVEFQEILPAQNLQMDEERSGAADPLAFPVVSMGMDLPSACEAYFAKHTRKELQARPGLSKTAPFVLEEAAKSNRFKNIRITDFVHIIDTEKEAQLEAMTFWLDPETAYVAFRGTDNTIVGWKEDFAMSYLPSTLGQKLAVEYLNRTFSGRDVKLYVGGHSKGGNLAVYASAFCKPRVKEKIMRIYSNDGPGFREIVTATPEFGQIRSRIFNIVPESTIVGMLMIQSGRQMVVKSSSFSIWQHDPYTWAIYGNHFVETTRSQSSVYIEKTLENWMEGVSNEEREGFVEALFSFLESSGAETFEQMRKGGTETPQKMLQFLKEFPKEKKDQFVDTLLQLLKSSWDTAVENLKKKD